jgi:hypothetical protein
LFSHHNITLPSALLFTHQTTTPWLLAILPIHHTTTQPLLALFPDPQPTTELFQFAVFSYHPPIQAFLPLTLFPLHHPITIPEPFQEAHLHIINHSEISKYLFESQVNTSDHVPLPHKYKECKRVLCHNSLILVTFISTANVLFVIFTNQTTISNDSNDIPRI